MPGASGARPSFNTISVPLFFEANQGQTDSRVKFLARGAGYGLFLTSDEAVLELQGARVNRQASFDRNPEPASPAVIRMRLDGARSRARVTGASPLPGKSSYFIGNNPKKWRHDVPHFERVEYAGVYPGVELAYYGNQGQLEYDFRVAPGANPKRIAMSFDGASAKLEAGDLVLATSSGDVRFHAPHIYQMEGTTPKTVAGSFRQLAANRIGFEIGAYDKSRELIIDPTLLYSTYLGGTGGGGVGESATQVAIGTNGNIYIAGSTTSTTFPTPLPNSGAYPPVQANNAGQTDVFIAEINPTLTPNTLQLVYSTYLGGSQSETLAGLGVDPHGNVYVAGTTTSSDFPTNGKTPAFQISASGTHGFLSMIGGDGNSVPYGDLGTLYYSTYLAGNGSDFVSGLAIDGNGNAFVTGTTTSTDSATGFPSTTNALQVCPFLPGAVNCTQASGPLQFFASKVYTGPSASGPASMIYSTYFGGGNPGNAQSTGGGIAVDTSGNMYITGTTNMQNAPAQGGAAFPILNAEQACLNRCVGTGPTDAFLAKINPTQNQNPGLIYSTYLGGSDFDTGNAVALDSAGNAYVTGGTNSTDWLAAGTPFQSTNHGGGDAYIVKIGNVNSGIAPLDYFTYIGGSASDFGTAIAVDSLAVAHVTGSTNSPDLPVTGSLPQQPGYGGNNDAFVAAIPTINLLGNSLVYLGGNQFDQGTSIALDPNNTPYVAGVTSSGNFPATANAYQGTLSGLQNAFVAKVGAVTTLQVAAVADYPTPSPAPAGNMITFLFTVSNTGTEVASSVTFTATVPTTGISTATAGKVTSGTGSCLAPQNGIIVCSIPSIGVAATATVQVTLTPTIPVINSTITVYGVAGLPDGTQSNTVPEQDQVTDFAISVTPNTQTVTAGQSTPVPYTVTVTPLPTYNATVTLSVSNLPANSTSTWVPSTAQVVLSGTGSASATLNIATQARPVTTGSLLRGGPWYATLLPVGGLSLLGLGLGAGFTRRRWLAGAFLAMVLALIALQPACGSNSSSTTATGGTPAGPVTLHITAAAGSDSHNQDVQLIVQ